MESKSKGEGPYYPHLAGPDKSPLTGMTDEEMDKLVDNLGPLIERAWEKKVGGIDDQLPDRPPNALETLVALGRLGLIAEQYPDLYEKHTQAFDMTAGFVAVLESNWPKLWPSLSFTESSLTVSASLISNHYEEMGITDKDMKWIDDNMTGLLQTMIPVVNDPDFPTEWKEIKWAILGAFEI